MRSILLCTCLFCVVQNAESRNNPYGKYGAIVRLPMLPEQQVYIIVKNKHKGRIILEGNVRLNENFMYSMKDRSRMVVTFGSAAKKLMRQYKCSIVEEFNYDWRHDAASFNIKVLFWNINVVLNSIKPHMHDYDWWTLFLSDWI